MITCREGPGSLADVPVPALERPWAVFPDLVNASTNYNDVCQRYLGMHAGDMTLNAGPFTGMPVQQVPTEEV